MRPIAALIVGWVLYTGAAARGQAYFVDDPRADRDFAFSVGYSHLFLDGSNTGPLEEQGGLRLDGRISTPVSESLPHLRVAASLALEFYVSEQGGDVEEFDEVIVIFPDDWTQLTVIEPELQASWRHPIGRDLYLEPGLGFSAIIGNYVRGEEVFGFVDEDLDRWALGAAGRVFLRGALVRGRWSYGLEGSYSYGWLDFDDAIGGDIQRGYLGFFFAHSF